MDFATYQNLINQNKHRQDNSLSVRFYDKAVKTDKLNDDGIPVFKSVCYCEIRIKDNTTEVFDQPASKDKIERFPIEYARYQMTKEKTIQGTPLEMFAFLTASEISACRYHGVYTVEALADLSKEQADSLHLTKEHISAQKFVSLNKDVKRMAQLSELAEKYQDKIAELEKRIKELSCHKTRRKFK